MPPKLVDSIRWDLFAKGLEDAEYFFMLDRGIHQLRQRSSPSSILAAAGKTSSSSAVKDDICRQADTAAILALDRVKEVVWSFPGSRNISSFLVDTYSTNVTLLHEVQDTVALALESIWQCI